MMPEHLGRNVPSPAVAIFVVLAFVPLLAGKAVAQQPRAHSDIQLRPPEGEVPCISAARLNIGFETAEPGRLTKVELWYTQDQAATWHQQTGTRPEANGIAFDPPADGLYGFYIILHNAGGASAPAPKPGTPPQHWVRVDRAAPLVQLLQLVPDERFDLNRTILLRWATRDDNLPDRPVTLHYRTAQTKRFRLVAESLAANSTYRWTVPEDASGKLEIKITATDLAGNRGQYVADWLRIQGGEVWDVRAGQAGGGTARPPAAGGGTKGPRDRGIEGSATTTAAGTELWHRRPACDPTGETPVLPGAPAPQVSSQAAERRFHEMPEVDPRGDPGSPTRESRETAVLSNRVAAGVDVRAASEAASPQPQPSAAEDAKKRYDLGTWYRLRGEHELAVARFREALSLDPNLLQARNDLAGLLYIQGDHKSAEREFEALLEKDPQHRSALKSLAFVQAARCKFDCSEETLQKLLLFEPEDAEAWLHLGDVRMYLGDRWAAREAWAKAGFLKSAEKETADRAKKRLEAFPRDRLPGDGPGGEDE
ncbi:MAG: tetratricopeptide repeat protein [Planctomycetota bacterium]